MSKLTVGIIQDGPVYFDKKKSLKKAQKLIKEAVAKKAKLIVFGETWLSGYPAWLDYCPEVALWNDLPAKKVFAKMYKNGIEVPGNETDELCALAQKHKVTICIGLNEVVSNGPGNGTIYNTLIIISEKGEIANHHRKLMPTFSEKLVYGLGDGHGLKTVNTSFGKIGGLICWEHWMPLSRQILHNSGELIHIALWPKVHEMHQIASRHYAFEGRCFVIAVGQLLKVKDLPKNLKLPKAIASKPEKLLLNGGSCIIGPDGKFLLGPQFDKKGIIIFELKGLEKTIEERMTLDVSGHYARPDVFSFSADKNRRTNMD